MGCVYFEWSNKDKELLTAYETVFFTFFNQENTEKTKK